MAQQKPKPADLAEVDYTPPRRGWRDLPVEFRKGTYNYAAPRRHVEYLGLPNPRDWQPHDADWKLPADWKQIILDGMKRPAGSVPVVPALHGHLRPLRRVRGQVPLLPGTRRSEEHAGAQGRVDPLGLPALLHPGRPAVRPACRRARPHRGRPEGVVLLLLPVHRVPALFGVLPVRDRHRGDHDDRPRTAEPGGLQHPVGHRARRHLRPHRQPPRRPAARLQATAWSSPPTKSRN